MSHSNVVLRVSMVVLVVAACRATPQDGSFTVSGTKILDPAGKEFLVKGVNVNGPGWVWSRATVPDTAFIIRHWKFNLVRICCKLGGSSSELDRIIDAFTSRGVVAMPEIHDFTGKYPSGQSLTDLANWWKGVASRHKNNPRVWFDLMNEPGGMEALSSTWKTVHDGLVTAIRGTGANNIIVIEDHHWANASGLDPSTSGIVTYGTDLTAKHRNIAFNNHCYNEFVSNGEAKLKAHFDRTDSRKLCVFIGEFGVYGSSSCPTVPQTVMNVVVPRGVGRIVWHWDGGDANDLTTSGNGNGNLITPVNGSRPTNLTAMGKLVWDDNHATTGTFRNVAIPVPAVCSEAPRGLVSVHGRLLQATRRGPGAGLVALSREMLPIVALGRK